MSSSSFSNVTYVSGSSMKAACQSCITYLSSHNLVVSAVIGKDMDILYENLHDIYFLPDWEDELIGEVVAEQIRMGMSHSTSLIINADVIINNGNAKDKVKNIYKQPELGIWMYILSDEVDKLTAAMEAITIDPPVQHERATSMCCIS